MCCNKRWVMAAALCGALAASVHAANVTLTWDATQRPTTLGDPATGALAFEYNDEGQITKLTATPVDGGTIVVTGDQLTANNDSHFIMAAGGELVFSNKVESSWNIAAESTVTNTATVTDARTISYSGANLDTAYTTLFKNRRLEDWMPLTTGNKNGKGWWQSDGIPTYNIRWEADGTLTAQRQASLGKINDDYGNGVGIVKFQLKQDGDDIAGRAIYAGYWSQSVGPLGTDSDVVFANPEKYDLVNQGVSTPSRNEGYGINKITLSRVKGLPTIRFAGGLSMGGVLFARAYTRCIYERATTGSIQYGYQADANGVLTFRDPVHNFDPSCNAANTGALPYGIQGSGTVEFEATDALYGDETYDTVTEKNPRMWIPTDWVTVAKGQQLAGMTGATGLLGGSSMNAHWRGTSGTLQLLNIAADGQTATGQFQYLIDPWDNNKKRCIALIVALRQIGDDVQMCVTKATAATTNPDAKYGTDLSGEPSYDVTTSDSVSVYGLHDVTLQFKGKAVKTAAMGRYAGIRNMAGSTAVPGCKAQLVIKGTDKTVMRYVPAAGNGHVLPYTDGLLRVQKGGEVIQIMTGRGSQTAMWVDDRALIRIEKDGVYRQQSDWGVGITQKVALAGGEYRVRDVSTVASTRCILNLLTLEGDVKLVSCQTASDCVRAGYNQDSTWAVRGTAPSTCDVPLTLWGCAECAAGGNTMTFVVADVTESAASDFIMNKALTVDSGEPDMLGIYKTGPGTMQLNAAYNMRGKMTFLKKGTLLVNGSSLTQAADPVTIDGGTLATAAGTANALGVLTVGEAGGGITLGEGATLSFADSSAATWTGTEKVIVTGFVEKSIRFGTSANGLTAAQCARFRTNDKHALILDADGYLTRSGFTLIIR